MAVSIDYINPLLILQRSPFLLLPPSLIHQSSLSRSLPTNHVYQASSSISVSKLWLHPDLQHSPTSTDLHNHIQTPHRHNSLHSHATQHHASLPLTMPEHHSRRHRSGDHSRRSRSGRSPSPSRALVLADPSLFAPSRDAPRRPLESDMGLTRGGDSSRRDGPTARGFGAGPAYGPSAGYGDFGNPSALSPLGPSGLDAAARRRDRRTEREEEAQAGQDIADIMARVRQRQADMGALGDRFSALRLANPGLGPAGPDRRGTRVEVDYSVRIRARARSSGRQHTHRGTADYCSFDEAGYCCFCDAWVRREPLRGRDSTRDAQDDAYGRGDRRDRLSPGIDPLDRRGRTSRLPAIGEDSELPAMAGRIDDGGAGRRLITDGGGRRDSTGGGSGREVARRDGSRRESGAGGGSRREGRDRRSGGGGSGGGGTTGATGRNVGLDDL